MNATNQEKQFCTRRVHASFVAAFTLTELLVVIAILALLAATQLPALTGGKAPVGFTHCMNNLRQIGQATMAYKDDNTYSFPFGTRCTGAGTGPGSVIDPTTWPMQLQQHLGNTTNQPNVYRCPSERGAASGWVFQVHYTANRYLLSDTGNQPIATSAAKVRNPAIYWMFIDKGPSDTCNIRSGSLKNPILVAWNIPPGSPQYRRHNGSTSSVAADGHVEWLRTPPYQPGALPPPDFVELGDCANGQNPASTWPDSGRIKLYSRYHQGASDISF